MTYSTANLLCYRKAVLNRSMRYALVVGHNRYLAACYEATGSGILITDKPEDACTYVTLDKALAIANAVAPNLDMIPSVVEVCY